MAGTYGLGVDLGTTYTAAAIWRDGRAESVPLGLRAHTVPSVLFLREDGVLLVGEAAARRGATEPERVAREFKREFGSDVPLFLGDREITAEELAGQLLRWVVETVTEREGGPPAHVTLTHPASWRRHRTGLLVTAAEQAGLTDVGLLAEPVAAAAYHASTERLAPGKVLAVYDLGGGTFDATVVRKTGAGFAVAGEPGGDDRLGGVDFDQVVLDHIATTLGPAWRTLDLEDDAVLAALARVREQAVEAKEALSVDVEASVPVILPGITREVRITRGEFEAAVRIPLLRSVDVLAQALASAGANPATVHAVLLVGGSSRIPLVSQLIATELRIPVALDAHPKYAICLGAAIAAGARLAPKGAHRLPPSGPPGPPGYGGPPPWPGPVVPGGGPEWQPPPGRPPGRPAQRPPEPLRRHPAPVTGTGPMPPVRPGPVPPPRQRPPTGPVPIRPTHGEPPSRPIPVVRPAAEVRPPPGRPTPVRPVPVPAAAARPAGVAVAEAEPPAAVVVDLRQQGIMEVVDTFVPVAPAARPSWAPVIKARDEPVTVTHVADRSRGRRTAVITALAALLVVAGITAVAVFARPEPTPQGPGTPTATPARTAAPVPVAGTAVFTEQAVPGKPDEHMNGLVPLGADAVAVGASDADDSPRAWRLEGGTWTAAEVTESPLVGAMNSVARLPGRRGELVAVGWVAPRPAAGAPTPSGRDRQPAVWTSPDGATWTMAGAGDLGTGIGTLGELYAVTVDPGGELVATGVDWTKDTRSGDGTLLRSGDGKAWRAVPVTGLDGLGPTAQQGLLVEPTGLVAVGSRLGADSTEAVVWTSPDGVAWTETAVLEHAGPGAAEAAGVVRSADGQLVVAGTATEIDGTPVPAVWAGPGPDALRLYGVDAPGAAVGGIAVVADAVSAVGSAPGGDGRVPAAWGVELRAG